MKRNGDWRIEKTELCSKISSESLWENFFRIEGEIEWIKILDYNFEKLYLDEEAEEYMRRHAKRFLKYTHHVYRSMYLAWARLTDRERDRELKKPYPEILY